MSRHEEKEKALNDLFPIPPEGESYGIKMARHGFNLGASWADERPRKGLVDVEKVCEWLKEQKEMVGVSFQDDFYERFRKAMEE